MLQYCLFYSLMTFLKVHKFLNFPCMQMTPAQDQALNDLNIITPSELHQIASEYLFEAEDESDPDHHTLNTKGEFVLHDLFKVCPKYLTLECIENDDGTMIMESETVEYLVIYFDNRFQF